MHKAKARVHANQVWATLAEKLDVECLHLSAPAVAPSSRARAELVALPGIWDTLREGAGCDVAVVGMGGILPDSTMVEAGYFTLDEFLGLRERGVVGDVCCHFLGDGGEPRLPELSERIVGLDLDQLRAIPKTMGVATGSEKAAGIAAVLGGGYVKTLVCDEDLARSLLDSDGGGRSEVV